MKGWLTVIGGAISLAVLLLGWYLTPTKIQERAFEGDEKERDKFLGLAISNKPDAQRMWMLQVRKNRQTKRR